MEKKHFLKLIIFVLAIGLSFLVIGGATQNAHAIPIEYIADLNGASEVPPTGSPGIGFAEVGIDIIAHTLSMDVTFSDLVGDTVAAAIHGPSSPLGNAGIITTVPLPGFPLGVTSGTYSHTFDTTLLSTFLPAFVVNFGGGTAAGAEAALAASLAEGKAYFNIHTNFFPGGEIRGTLEPLSQSVPEPTTMLLLGSGLIGLLGFRKKFFKK